MKPIKRHAALQAISHDHHQGLLVCWKIRAGIANSIAPERIKAFVDFYYNTHLQQHFKLEEAYIFPILGEHHDFIKQALAEHISLEKLFLQSDDLINVLSQIEKQLQAHIRFEERVLFNEIQIAATPKEMAEVAEIHSDNKEMNEQIESWKDNFWELQIIS
jgi:iron-sulfur cluster repair protein YtfE (RIC family)